MQHANVRVIVCFFFISAATPEIYTLSLHDALPICSTCWASWSPRGCRPGWGGCTRDGGCRSEEHTSELQSHSDLVCRLLLEKKKPTSAQKRLASTIAARP